MIRFVVCVQNRWSHVHNRAACLNIFAPCDIGRGGRLPFILILTPIATSNRLRLALIGDFPDHSPAFQTGANAGHLGCVRSSKTPSMRGEIGCKGWNEP
jgi:hypothetical protein